MSKRKKSTKEKSYFNKVFSKIFVINLFDKIDRWKKVNKQFKRRNIEAERFIAIDGRCKSQGHAGCEAKLDSFKISYDIKISNKKTIH